jgi:Tfp pilus assembly protein PilF
MRLLFLLLVIAGIGGGTYFILSKLIKNKKSKRIASLTASLVVILLVVLLGVTINRGNHAADGQCGVYHATESYPPSSTTSAMDYFDLGNYDYDKGDCTKAVEDYAKSIELNPNYPQAYNNRAYTYLRLRNYDAALADLNKAIALNPNYIQALVNRGDIYNNFIVDKDKAIIDYQKVISLGGTKGTSVCSKLLDAQSNGVWDRFFKIPQQIFGSCK